jgi:hypothetical protein
MVAFAIPRAQAADDPVAVLTVRSIDSTFESVRYLLNLAGHRDQAIKLDELLSAFTSGKKFQGIDTKKPLGAFVTKLGEAVEGPPFALFVPLTNQDEFIDLLKQIGMEPSTPERGTYQVDTPLGITLAMRFAHEHAFFAMNADVLADLPDPRTFVPKANLNALIAATARLDRVPDDVKKQVLDQFQEQFEADKAKREGESDEEHAVRLVVMKCVRATVEDVIRDGQEATFSFHVDQAEGNVMIDLAMTAKMGSRLADKIKDLGPAQPIAPVHFEVSVGKLALFFMPDESDGRVAEIRKLFTGADKGKDKVRVSLYGGDALHLRLDVNAQVVKLFAALRPPAEAQ